ncbi:DUF4352 domain-containing protein [Clostridium sp. MB40-C1]|uniref:DUF4352 domain-containing protein n=1 Tax=Clostridium sp. MB40-C1 TaxID=3070996 RepID=UPI0027E11602|nr:DUF4352 domain-containing protein [Clostridium sp. MB40-C1]WMJ81986.1 DUF4352 domain-containing protein [Clostridium sp. MB40-C1]
MKLRKAVPIIISTLVIGLFVGCGSNAKSTSTSAKNSKTLNKEEFEQMYTDVSKFKGDKVDFYARIFIEPDKDDKGTYFQCYANNSDKLNTMVGIGDPKLDVKDGDIVHIVGTVKDKFEGENAIGGKVAAPVIQADKIDKSDYATAFDPAIKTIKIDKEINQNGYVLKLNKVEVAKNETRAYVTITNNTKNKINFYDFNSKLTQGSKQIAEGEQSFGANYKKVQSEIMPGVKEEGIVLFKQVDPKGDNLKIHFEGSSENYELQFKPFTFDIKLK